MKALVFALVLVGCAPLGAAASPSPTFSTSLAPRTFDSHSFTVGLFFSDDADVPIGTTLMTQLPNAWRIATSGRSAMRFTTETPDVYLFLGEEPPARISAGTQNAWFFIGGTLRFVYLHRGAPNPLLEAVHELGHTSGCCTGALGAGPDGHWADCVAPAIEIMCHFQGSATTFSERELRGMGLGAP